MDGFRSGEHLLWRTQRAGSAIDDVGAEGEEVDGGGEPGVFEGLAHCKSGALEATATEARFGR